MTSLPFATNETDAADAPMSQDMGALDDFTDVGDAFDNDPQVNTAARRIVCIDSEDMANWYLRKLANLAAERERINANAKAMLAAIKRDEESLTAHFGPQLEQWAKEELIRRRSKTKTLPLFQGVISFKIVRSTLSVRDTEAALVHARTFYPELIETVQRLKTEDYSAIARDLRKTETRDDHTGEMIPGPLLPGCEVKPERESMSIKFVALSGGGADSEAGE
jgi:phage host-nuclease inhibitor protein Gam